MKENILKIYYKQGRSPLKIADVYEIQWLLNTKIM
jgi:hypothetical protein